MNEKTPEEMLAEAEAQEKHHAQRELLHKERKEAWASIIAGMKYGMAGRSLDMPVPTLNDSEKAKKEARGPTSLYGMVIKPTGRGGQITRGDYVEIILKQRGKPMGTREIYAELGANGIVPSTIGSVHTSLYKDKLKRFVFSNSYWDLAENHPEVQERNDD